MKKLLRTLAGIICSLTMTTVVVCQGATVRGRAGTLLTKTDVQQITRLATAGRHTPWLIDVVRSMTLPEEWYAFAYLSADSETATLRRGRIARLGLLLAGPVVGYVIERTGYGSSLMGVGLLLVMGVVVFYSLDRGRPVRV